MSAQANRRLAWPRLILSALVLCILVAVSASARAQQAAIVDPDASVVNEQTLLQEFPRIQGDIDQLDPRARVLIQPEGRVWDHFHEVTLHWLGAIIILGTIAGLAGAYFLLGRIRISKGRSGRKVPRFSAFERFVHWLTAASFVVLAISGLNVTFGKLVLMPLIGPDAFSAFAQAAKYAHDFTSFPFMLGIALITVIWIKDNIPSRIDVAWLRQGGGFIASKHAPAGRFNAGEKLVFWGALAAGAGVSASGLLLLFPFYVTDILGMQIAQVVHSIIAILFVALILAHIYIGTLGMEGAFEAMGRGSVDFNWAQEHHDIWLEDLIAKDRPASAGQSSLATPAE